MTGWVQTCAQCKRNTPSHPDYPDCIHCLEDPNRAYPSPPWRVDGGGAELGITAQERETVMMFGVDDDGDQWWEVASGVIPFIVRTVNDWYAASHD